MYMSSPVADGTLIYGFSNKRKGQLFCLDAATGTPRWTTEGRGGTNAALQSAGDNLIVLTDLVGARFFEFHGAALEDGGDRARSVSAIPRSFGGRQPPVSSQGERSNGV